MNVITSWATFLTSILLILLGLFVLLKNRKSEVNFSFSLICLSSFIWLFAYSQAYTTSDQNLALFWFKIGYPGVVFIAVTYYHFSIIFLNLRKLRSVLIGNYLLGILFVFLFRTTNFFMDGVHLFFWGFYPKAGKFHPLFLVFFMGLINASLCHLAYFFFFKKDKISLIKWHQLKYFLLALSIYTIACVDFIPNYGVEVFPFGFIPASIFLIIISYSIVRYRLLEISLAITRTSIFVSLYSVILGIPFIIAFGWQQGLIYLFSKNWWIVPLVTSTVLATVGPFIYIFIQKRAEDNLLKEQRKYQATLRQASTGMGRVKDLKRLLNLIVHIVTRAVKIEHCEVFLLHEESRQFILKAAKGRQFSKEEGVIPDDSKLIACLKKDKEALVAEEIKQKAQDFADADLKEMAVLLERIDAALVVPSFIENRLIAIIVLGKKESGKLYSQDDLSVFSILANQAALAIENAQFLEDMKKTNEQLFKAEKMATIGTMADGLSHQINNRLHAMGFIAGDALDTIKRVREAKMQRGKEETRGRDAEKQGGKEGDPEIGGSGNQESRRSGDQEKAEGSKEYEASGKQDDGKSKDADEEFLKDLEHALDRIQTNVKQGGSIVEGLLKYTRKGSEAFEAIDLNKLLDAAVDMVQYKIKLSEFDMVRHFNEEAPCIRGNFTQLQEVLFNVIDNSYDAMVQRKQELKEQGFYGQLEFFVEKKGKNLVLVIKDNGIGVKKEDQNKLFTPFFTTKLSSKKGTGLGLYVIRQIIETNHGGRVEFESEHAQGSTTRLTLPVATEKAMAG